MINFGISQKQTFLFGASVREVFKFLGIVGTGIFTMLIVEGVSNSLVGTFVAVIEIALATTGTFFRIEGLPAFQYIMIRGTKGLKTSKWKPIVLDHLRSKSGAVAPDLDKLKLAISQSESAGFLHHEEGQTLIWKLLADNPMLSAFAYRPESEQADIFNHLKTLLESISDIPHVIRFGFTTLDSPSTGDELAEHLADMGDVPQFYEELISSVKSHTRETTIWLWVTLDFDADKQSRNIAAQEVTERLQLMTLDNHQLSATEITWDVINRIANPGLWYQQQQTGNFCDLSPSAIHPDLHYLHIDDVYHFCHTVSTLPRSSQPLNWWALLQASASQSLPKEVSLATTIVYETIPPTRALKKSEAAATAALQAQNRSRLDGRAINSTEERRLHDAVDRSREIAQGAKLHQLGIIYDVITPDLVSGKRAGEEISLRLQSASAETSRAYGKQFETFSALLPTGRVTFRKY